MDGSQITINEVMNDGKVVHLYFNNLTGLYMAVGLSAYIAMKHIGGVESYSEQLQMPMVQMTKAQYEELCVKLHVQKDAKKGYVLIEAADAIDEADYQNWASKLRNDV